MTVRLYGVLRSRATRVAWLANEIGLKLEIVPVIQGYRLPEPLAPGAPLNTTSPEFLAVNPAGMIPCIDDDGLVLGESLAITLYLAKRYGGALGPRDLAEEAHMLEWALWAATACEPYTIVILYNRVSYPPEKRDPVAVAAAIAALKRPFARLEQALSAHGDHLVGGRFSVADVNVAEILRYAQAAPELFAEFPRVSAWLSACHARPAFKAMMAAREVEPA